MDNPVEKRLSGLPVSEGVALARARLVRRADSMAAPAYLVAEAHIEAELERLEGALERARGALDAFVAQVQARAGEAHAGIFAAQRMMLEDTVLIGQFTGLIRGQRVNAEAAVARTLGEYEALIAEVDDEYLRARSTDVVELRRRILEHLTPSVEAGNAPVEAGPWIVVAEELTPGETVTMDTANTVGFITERGGPGSHTAILARALGIPAVTGIGNPFLHFAEGEEVLLNGMTGEVIVRPGARTLQLYPSAQRLSAGAVRVVPPVEGFTVMANISTSADVAAALASGAEGVGLYRTEFELLAAGRLLDEEEQFARYAQVARQMQGAPLYARLFDLGGDKPAPFLEDVPEENPSLGFRGSRLLLAEPDLLAAQARALARASIETPICVVYPMIVDLEQFLLLREIVRQQTADIAGARLTHAPMFEVPSACLAAEELFEAADAACIGTNDLIQYLFAVDRNNERVANDYHPDRPVFWKVLTGLVHAAERYGKPLSLCGELGAQPKYVPRLIEIGIRRVSVSPRRVGLARAAAMRALRRAARHGINAATSAV